MAGEYRNVRTPDRSGGFSLQWWLARRLSCSNRATRRDVPQQEQQSCAMGEQDRCQRHIEKHLRQDRSGDQDKAGRGYRLLPEASRYHHSGCRMDLLAAENLR